MAPQDIHAGRPWTARYPPYLASALAPDLDALPGMDAMCMDACDRHGPRAAYRDGAGHALTYAQLREQALALARWLAGRGIQPGDRIAIMLPNVLAFPVAALGAVFGRHVLTCINPMYTAREVLHQLRDSGARVLIVLDEMQATIEPVLRELALDGLVVAGAAQATAQPRAHAEPWRRLGAVSLADIVNAGADGWRPAARSQPGELALLQYTGGTTGVSKGAMLLQRNLAAVAELLRAWFEPWCKQDLGEEQLLMVAALPMYHIYALMCCLFMSMRMGSTALLIRNPRDIDGLIDALRDSGFHILWGVNATFAALVHHPRAKEIDFSRMRASVGGGTAMQAPIAKAWFALAGRPVIEGYGLSETAPTVTLNRLDDPEFSGTVGYPVPATDVSLRDAQGQAVAVGERGEICIRGPMVMAGYWQRPDESAAAFTPDGYFRTGDVGTMTADGRFSIVDRLKDMVIVSGFNVYPNEVEAVLVGHPAIAEAAVVGVPDPRSGERLVAYVVAKSAAVDAQSVLSHARRELTAYKVPREIVFRSELPKSTVGKVLRRTLRDEYKEPAE